MGGLVGIDLTAVFEIARTLGIEMHQGNLSRIKALESEAIAKSREKQQETHK